MDWKKLWPEALVVIGIIVEFSIKKLSQIEASNEKTTVVSLLLAILVALSARHFGSKPDASNPPAPPPPPETQKQQYLQQSPNPHTGSGRRP